jgi:hypothetical protein
MRRAWRPGRLRAGLERLFGAVLALVALAHWTGAALGQELTDIAPAARAAITVEPGVIVRTAMPATLFGFNINHYHFQQDLWREARRQPDPAIVEALRPFRGALYRYPGGLVANRFWWQEAIGPVAERGLQRAVGYDAGTRVLFGLEEYLNFVGAVGGHPWYVVNLVGWDRSAMIQELSEREVAASNAGLATFFKIRGAVLPRLRYYQLGNELDRSDYQWPAEKYVQRARSSIDAIRAVDPEARFVAFLRDFDWTYSGGDRDGSVSRYQDLITQVMDGLPDVNDISFQFYYDDPGMDRAHKQIPWRIQQLRRAMAVAAARRNGKTPTVWITEHARGINIRAGQSMTRAAVTSNLAAALSTADFLIALAQIPEIQGAAWHGLNAGPWQLFDATIDKRDLSPRPVYFGLRVLRAIDLPIVLGTRTRSPGLSGYAGGYDVRGVAFTEPGARRLGLWAVNRAPRPTEVEFVHPEWRNQSITVRHYFLAGRDGVNPDDTTLEPSVELEPIAQRLRFSDQGTLMLELPPASVSSFMIEKSDTLQQ